MKRCPQCNRVENDDALTFCRADGTPLVSDSGSVSRNGYVREGRGILESQMRFEVARRVDALGEQQRLEMVLNGMEQVHPGARDHPC